jgi:hypothetical protein
LFGNKLVPVLKKAMIFGKKSLDIHFIRTITFEDKSLIISDKFKGSALPGKKLYRASHYSLRHVSSAGLFVPEEMIGIDGELYEADPRNGELVVSREIFF